MNTSYVLFCVKGPVIGPLPRLYNCITGEYTITTFNTVENARNYVKINTNAGGRFHNRTIIIIPYDKMALTNGQNGYITGIYKRGSSNPFILSNDMKTEFLYFNS